MGIHVLVVDDCEDVRFLLALKLHNMGFTVSEACDGVDALEMINDSDNDDYDVLLLDVIMPKLTGSQLLKKLRKNDLAQKTKVIFITAHYDEQLHETLTELGAHDVLRKPIKGDELNKRIKKVINKAA